MQCENNRILLYPDLIISVHVNTVYTQKLVYFFLTSCIFSALTSTHMHVQVVEKCKNDLNYLKSYKTIQ